MWLTGAGAWDYATRMAKKRTEPPPDLDAALTGAHATVTRVASQLAAHAAERRLVKAAEIAPRLGLTARALSRNWRKYPFARGIGKKPLVRFDPVEFEIYLDELEGPK
jgi:transcriptional regulator GlxA family with amidase domain